MEVRLDLTVMCTIVAKTLKKSMESETLHDSLVTANEMEVVDSNRMYGKKIIIDSIEEWILSDHDIYTYKDEWYEDKEEMLMDYYVKWFEEEEMYKLVDLF